MFFRKYWAKENFTQTLRFAINARIYYSFIRILMYQKAIFLNSSHKILCTFKAISAKNPTNKIEIIHETRLLLSAKCLCIDISDQREYSAFNSYVNEILVFFSKLLLIKRALRYIAWWTFSCQFHLFYNDWKWNTYSLILASPKICVE